MLISHSSKGFVSFYIYFPFHFLVREPVGSGLEGEDVKRGKGFVVATTRNRIRKSKGCFLDWNQATSTDIKSITYL